MALLEATAHGDREAFATFYRRYLATVVAFLMCETRDRELAADLAGEVFCAALLAAGRYRAEQPTAVPWLRAIAGTRSRSRAATVARRIGPGDA